MTRKQLKNRKRNKEIFALYNKHRAIEDIAKDYDLSVAHTYRIIEKESAN